MDTRSVEALELIASELQQIRTLLTVLAMPETASEPMGCSHPESERMALGTTGAGWRCLTCGHQELTP